MVKRVKENNDQWVMEQGELVRYDNTFGPLTEADGAEALRCEQEILQMHGQVQKDYYALAQKLADFKTRRLFVARNFSSFSQWADSEELKGIGKRTAYNLVRIVEEALPILAKNDAMHVLPSLSTLYDMLPILRDENAEEKFVEAAYQVQDKTARDAKQVIKEIRGIEDKDTESLMFFKVIATDRGDEYTVKIQAASRDDFYWLTEKGTVKKKDMPRLEQLFKGYVEYVDG